MSKEARIEALLSNISNQFFGKIQLKERTPEETAEHNRILDAVVPPAWYYPPYAMSDPSQLYDAYSSLTAEEIKATVDLMYSRYVKSHYRSELAEHGSIEALQLFKEQDQERREAWRLSRNAKQGTSPTE